MRLGDMYVRKINHNLLSKYYVCAHIYIFFLFPVSVDVCMSLVTSIVDFISMCLGLLSSIVPSIHLYLLNLELCILHLWDIFLYYFFAFFSLLSSVFWTSYSKIGPHAGPLIFLVFLISFLFVFHYL